MIKRSQKIFFLFLENECALDLSHLLFVILDAVLCALKCIFLLIDEELLLLLCHSSNIFFLLDNTASVEY